MKTKKISKKELTNKVKEIINKLLELLKIKTLELKVEIDKNNIINISLDTEDNGILIGYKGETIGNLQLIISLILYKKTDTWNKVLLNIGDYRQQREETLKKLALNMAQKAKFSGEAVVLPRLNPAERRIVHLELSDSTEVVTESIGEGLERRLIIKPKK